MPSIVAVLKNGEALGSAMLQHPREEPGESRKHYGLASM